MNREQDLETSMLYRLADVRQNILSEYFILFNLNIENFLFIYCSIIFLRKRMLQNHYFL